MRISLVVTVILLAAVAMAGCGGGSGTVSAGQTVNDELFTPNYASAPGVQLLHWNHLPIRVSFAIPTEWIGTPYGDPGIYSVAATAWNQPGKQPFITVVAYGAAADVVVQFVSRAELPPTAQGQTQCSYDSTNTILSTTLKVTRELPYGGTVSVGFLQVTVAHELGHALGIYGHSPDPNDLMYAAKSEGVSFVPTLRDFNTAMTAYPSYFISRAGAAREVKPHVPQGPIRSITIE